MDDNKVETRAAEIPMESTNNNNSHAIESFSTSNNHIPLHHQIIVEEDPPSLSQGKTRNVAPPLKQQELKLHNDHDDDFVVDHHDVGDYDDDHKTTISALSHDATAMSSGEGSTVDESGVGKFRNNNNHNGHNNDNEILLHSINSNDHHTAATNNFQNNDAPPIHLSPLKPVQQQPSSTTTTATNNNVQQKEQEGEPSVLSSQKVDNYATTMKNDEDAVVSEEPLVFESERMTLLEEEPKHSLYDIIQKHNNNNNNNGGDSELFDNNNHDHHSLPVNYEKGGASHDQNVDPITPTTPLQMQMPPMPQTMPSATIKEEQQQQHMDAPHTRVMPTKQEQQHYSKEDGEEMDPAFMLDGDGGGPIVDDKQSMIIQQQQQQQQQQEPTQQQQSLYEIIQNNNQNANPWSSFDSNDDNIAPIDERRSYHSNIDCSAESAAATTMPQSPLQTTYVSQPQNAVRYYNTDAVPEKRSSADNNIDHSVSPTAAPSSSPMRLLSDPQHNTMDQQQQQQQQHQGPQTLLTPRQQDNSRFETNNNIAPHLQQQNSFPPPQQPVFFDDNNRVIQDNSTTKINSAIPQQQVAVSQAQEQEAFPSSQRLPMQQYNEQPSQLLQHETIIHKPNNNNNNSHDSSDVIYNSNADNNDLHNDNMRFPSHGNSRMTHKNNGVRRIPSPPPVASTTTPLMPQLLQTTSSIPQSTAIPQQQQQQQQQQPQPQPTLSPKRGGDEDQIFVQDNTIDNDRNPYGSPQQQQHSSRTVGDSSSNVMDNNPSSQANQPLPSLISQSMDMQQQLLQQPLQETIVHNHHHNDIHRSSEIIDNNNNNIHNILLHDSSRRTTDNIENSSMQPTSTTTISRTTTLSSSAPLRQQTTPQNSNTVIQEQQEHQQTYYHSPKRGAGGVEVMDAQNHPSQSRFGNSSNFIHNNNSSTVISQSNQTKLPFLHHNTKIQQQQEQQTTPSPLRQETIRDHHGSNHQSNLDNNNNVDSHYDMRVVNNDQNGPPKPIAAASTTLPPLPQPSPENVSMQMQQHQQRQQSMFQNRDFSSDQNMLNNNNVADMNHDHIPYSRNSNAVGNNSSDDIPQAANQKTLPSPQSSMVAMQQQQEPLLTPPLHHHETIHNHSNSDQPQQQFDNNNVHNARAGHNNQNNIAASTTTMPLHSQISPQHASMQQQQQQQQQGHQHTSLPNNDQFTGMAPQINNARDHLNHRHSQARFGNHHSVMNDSSPVPQQNTEKAYLTETAAMQHEPTRWPLHHETTTHTHGSSYQSEFDNNNVDESFRNLPVVDLRREDHNSQKFIAPPIAMAAAMSQSPQQRSSAIQSASLQQQQHHHPQTTFPERDVGFTNKNNSGMTMQQTSRQFPHDETIQNHSTYTNQSQVVGNNHDVPKFNNIQSPVETTRRHNTRDRVSSNTTPTSSMALPAQTLAAPPTNAAILQQQRSNPWDNTGEDRFENNIANRNNSYDGRGRSEFDYIRIDQNPTQFEIAKSKFENNNVVDDNNEEEFIFAVHREEYRDNNNRMNESTLDPPAWQAGQVASSSLFGAQSVKQESRPDPPFILEKEFDDEEEKTDLHEEMSAHQLDLDEQTQQTATLDSMSNLDSNNGSIEIEDNSKNEQAELDYDHNADDYDHEIIRHINKEILYGIYEDDFSALSGTVFQDEEEKEKEKHRTLFCALCYIFCCCGVIMMVIFIITIILLLARNYDEFSPLGPASTKIDANATQWNATANATQLPTNLTANSTQLPTNVSSGLPLLGQNIFDRPTNATAFSGQPTSNASTTDVNNASTPFPSEQDLTAFGAVSRPPSMLTIVPNLTASGRVTRPPAGPADAQNFTAVGKVTRPPEVPTNPITSSPTEPPTTQKPTEIPTNPPTTQTPTQTPTNPPVTESPTVKPSTEMPTLKPSTETPTLKPSTEMPTEVPTVKPPTETPTIAPTRDLYDHLKNLQEVDGEQLDIYGSPQYRAYQYMNLVRDSFNKHPEEKLNQRFALATLYFATNGRSWNNNGNWVIFDDECSWYGVSCCCGGLVSKLELDSNNLTGEVVQELALLTQLQLLDFQGNNVRGAVPEKLCAPSTDRPIAAAVLVDCGKVTCTCCVCP